MEWFWKISENLQKSVAGSGIQNAAPSDLIFFLLLLWALYHGSRKGFSDMFGKFFGIFLVSMLTLILYPRGTALLTSSIPALPEKVAEAFSFVLLAVFLWISVSWGINVFGKFLKVEAQGTFKTVGGMVLGVLRMLLLLSFLAQFFLFLPIEPLREIFKEGRTGMGYKISQFAPDLQTLITSSFQKPAFKKSIESFKVGG